MWLDKLKALKKETGTTNKFIAEKTHRSERTIARFFSGETALGIDEVRDIVLLMGGSLDDILDESDFKMPIPEVEALKAEIDSLSKTIDEMIANETLLKAENAVMSDRIGSLTAENDILRVKLELKDEMLAIHKFYMKDNH